MSYYHIGIFLHSGKLLTKYDVIDENLVIDGYLISYLNNEEFVFSGKKINPKEIERFYAIHTDNDIGSVTKTMNQRRGYDKYSLSDIFSYASCYNEFDELLLKAKSRLQNNKAKALDSSIENNKDVFVVHGHDESMMRNVKAFIESIGYNPIILKEKPNQGKTIIEKIETYSNVAYAIVLYSPCDKGYDKNKPNEVKNRARQNVVFEHGYLLSKLSREKVCAIVKKDVERPGDLDGLVYVLYSGDWRKMIIKEFEKVGLPIQKSEEE
ncbi:MAG: nucleotide-binding protein [Bacilli bacterium]|nr:nucleotide-binding protein [Bacilli bacterium]